MNPKGGFHWFSEMQKKRAGCPKKAIWVCQLALFFGPKFKGPMFSPKVYKIYKIL
jgi:hypothetical protein